MAWGVLPLLYLPTIIDLGVRGFFMRFIATVVLAALLIVLMYLAIGGVVDGYFGGNIFPDRWERDSWSAPDSWSEWRDIVFVLMGFWFALAGLLLCVLLVALTALVLLLRRTIKQHAAPALDSLKLTLDNVKGTAEFVGESAVAPIVRVYSIVRGVRASVSAVSGFPSRVRGQSKRKRR